MLSKIRVLIFLLLATFLSCLSAQNTGTGLYKFGSFDSKGFDTINLGNLNAHFEIPIVNKPGRGIPFTYSVVYDSLVWSPITSNGLTYWQPDDTFGFHFQSYGAVIGYLTYSYFPTACGGGGTIHLSSGTSDYVYHDKLGRSHLFNYQVRCGTVYGDGSTSDGSGYSYNGSTVSTAHGTVINPAVISALSSSTAGSVNDKNGNTVTANSNNTYTDTLGVTELTIAGTGNANSPLQLTYPVPQQPGGTTSATATVYYKTYTVQTSFGCSGISEYGPVSVDLVDHITLGDSSTTYSFSYEPTPSNSGNVTGRLASITLPGGGVIGYSYSGGCSGSGINTDGTPSVLARSTTDGQKTYSLSNSQAPVYTSSTLDEKGNETDLSFISSSASGLVYETSRAVYQGPATGNIQLRYKTRAYNGLPSSTQLTSAISQISVTDEYNGIRPVTTVTTYDAAGSTTARTVEDASHGNAALLSTTTTYNSNEEPTSVQTTDPTNSNAVVTSATYGYDETPATATSGIPQHGTPIASPGNQTSSHISTGSGTLDSSTAYYDTGMPVSTTAPGNFTTSYTYDPTQAFATQTTLPTPQSGVQVSTSASYDANSGVQTSATGPNSGQTFGKQYDELLRPTKTTTPEGGQTSYGYTPTQVSAVTRMNTTQSTDQETFLDGYGRPVRVAAANGTGWYLTDYCYDATGLMQYQSTPYYSSAENPSGKACSSGAAKQYAYDALGRKTNVSSPDGSSVTFTYNGLAVESSTSNGVSRITQYDLLRRISLVCEISSNNSMPGSGSTSSCGADIAGTGFTTNYAYNLSAHTITVTQGVQTRVFQTDAAGRNTLVSEPESGTTSYSYAYNGTGLAVTRTRPQANQTSSSTLTTTTTQYDSLGRPVSVTYSDGTPTRTFTYDVGAISGDTSYVVGQLTIASTTSGGNTAGQRQFGYDVMGRVNETVACGVGTCGSYYAFRWYGYDLASNLTTETYASYVNGGSPVSLYYGYNAAGQLISMTGGQNNSTLSPSIYSAQATGPSGPTLVQYGNGLNGIFGYDSVGRTNLLDVCSGSTEQNCPGGSTVYWGIRTTVGNQVTLIADSAVGEGTTESYDEFGRLSGQSYLYGWNNTLVNYVYDRYGNRWQQNVTQGSGPQPQLTFNTSNNQIVGYQYDAVGNVINDGVHSYSYDAENNLTNIDNGATAAYTYDAQSQRIGISTASGLELYDYDLSSRRSTEWNSNVANIISAQYYAGASRVAYWTSSDGNIHFEHQDWLGTERARTSENGSVEGTYSSLPFGDNLQASGSDTNSGHFAMLDQDVSASFGLSHATFREYSSTSGRWMSPDSYIGSYHFKNPQSLNRYSYVHNRPLSHVDPSGQDAVESDDPCNDVTCFVSPDPDLPSGDGGGDPGDDLSTDSDPVPLPPGDEDSGDDTPVANLGTVLVVNVTDTSVTGTSDTTELDTDSYESPILSPAPNNPLDLNALAPTPPSGQQNRPNDKKYDCSGQGGQNTFGSCQFVCSGPGGRAATDIPLYKIQQACNTKSNVCPVIVDVNFREFDIFGDHVGVPNVVPNSCVYKTW